MSIRGLSPVARRPGYDADRGPLVLPPSIVIPLLRVLRILGSTLAVRLSVLSTRLTIGSASW